jgi:hypothetical protein
MRRYYLSFSTREALRKIGRALPLVILLVGICALLVTSCGTAGKIPPKDETVTTDSTAVHQKDSVHIKDEVTVRDSLMNIPIPTEQSTANNQLLQPSHLETSIAESDAWVDSTGLHHTLRNKSDSSLQANVPITEHNHTEEHFHEQDSTAVSTSNHSHIEYIEVEKKLTWWQDFRIKAFWPLALSLLLCLLYIFRKPLLKLAKIIV